MMATYSGAECLARGAKIIEEHDVEGALALLFDALDIYENESREANAQDIFRHGCMDTLPHTLTQCTASI
jgi:hypothetical protein